MLRPTLVTWSPFRCGFHERIDRRSLQLLIMDQGFRQISPRMCFSVSAVATLREVAGDLAWGSPLSKHSSAATAEQYAYSPQMKPAEHGSKSPCHLLPQMRLVRLAINNLGSCTVQSDR